MVEHPLRSLWRRLDSGERSRLVTDGGQPDDDQAVDEAEADERDGEQDDETNEETGEDARGIDGGNVEITEAGEAEPAEPEWEEPDLDELPEFEIRADQPVASGGSGVGAGEADTADLDAADADASGTGASGADTAGADEPDDPAAGMPNTARAPGASRISSEGTEAYIVALELCARLPEDVRLPEEAADLVPAAVEAELEQDVQAFVAAEFDNERPTVDTLTFEEADDEIWLRLRIGVPPESFADLDPDLVRAYALEQLEGVF